MPTENRIPAHDHERRCCSRHDAAQDPDRNKRLFLENELQWGSDPSFCYHGFSCPIGSWTEERLVRNLMRNMACMCNSMDLELNYDLDLADQKAEPLPGPPDTLHLNDLDMSAYIGDRRSSTPASASPSTSTSGSEKRKADTPLTNTTDNQSSNATPPKRKRKCVQKPGQTLCHCQTEKKRREIISQGYQNLSELVPALGNRNYTRKYILREAASYVESLVQVNKGLRRQLDGMKEQEKDLRGLFQESEGNFFV